MAVKGLEDVVMSVGFGFGNRRMRGEGALQLGHCGCDDIFAQFLAGFPDGLHVFVSLYQVLRQLIVCHCVMERSAIVSGLFSPRFASDTGRLANHFVPPLMVMRCFLQVLEVASGEQR